MSSSCSPVASSSSQQISIYQITRWWASPWRPAPSRGHGGAARSPWTSSSYSSSPTQTSCTNDGAWLILTTLLHSVARQPPVGYMKDSHTRCGQLEPTPQTSQTTDKLRLQENVRHTLFQRAIILKQNSSGDLRGSGC